jgi:hypothetical protein
MDISKKLRDITKKEAIDSYNELKETPSLKPDFSRIGLKALDYFFLNHRIKAKTKKHISFYEAAKNKEMIEHLNILVEKYKKKKVNEYDDIGLLKAQYQVFQLYYGTINQFRPMIAKYVYTMLKPKIGILDFSSGWGGRLLAAMSMDIPYIGIDANTKLENSYKKMIDAYNPTSGSANASNASDIHMIFKPSEKVDFSKFKYDLIFTSPPYFMIEEYETMPAYKSKQDFLTTFFIPVTMSAWNNLTNGGNMALNIPEEMYDAIKPYLPKIKKTFMLPLSNRHPNDAVVGNKLGKENKERHELIYVWHKQR